MLNVQHTPMMNKAPENLSPHKRKTPRVDICFYLIPRQQLFQTFTVYTHWLPFSPSWFTLEKKMLEFGKWSWKWLINRLSGKNLQFFLCFFRNKGEMTTLLHWHLISGLYCEEPSSFLPTLEFNMRYIS